MNPQEIGAISVVMIDVYGNKVETEFLMECMIEVDGEDYFVLVTEDREDSILVTIDYDLDDGEYIVALVEDEDIINKAEALLND